MLRVAVLAVILGCAAAADADLPDLPGTKTQDSWNEQDKNDIQQYKECTDIESFDPRIIGWWMGRTQMDAKSWHRVYDIHNVLTDGSGILNAINEKDHSKISRETPAKMWCKKYDNNVDKALLVQYGPTKYGQLTCISLEVPSHDDDEMLIGINQGLFTDPRVPHRFPVALDCLNYPYKAKYDSFTMWADQLYRKSYSKWYRTVAPKEGSDWAPKEKKSNLLSLLRLLAKVEQ